MRAAVEGSRNSYWTVETVGSYSALGGGDRCVLGVSVRPGERDGRQGNGRRRTGVAQDRPLAVSEFHRLDELVAGLVGVGLVRDGVPSERVEGREDDRPGRRRLGRVDRVVAVRDAERRARVDRVAWQRVEASDEHTRALRVREHDGRNGSVGRTAQVVELKHTAGLLDGVDDGLGQLARVEGVGALARDFLERPGVCRPADDLADRLELTV